MKPSNRKRSLALYLMIAVCNLLQGQTPCGASYARMVEEGDAMFRAGKYKEAFEKYRAARGCTEASHQVLDKRVEAVLEAVDHERLKADRSADVARAQQKNAERALRQAQIEKTKAKAAEKKANDVLDKIYFYQDRFGLAYEGGRYGYIDKDLKTKIAFSYSEAMPFDYTGYAWVKRGNFEQFMLDTLGNEYPLAYDVAEVKETTTALDLRNRIMDSLPQELFVHTQLKILMLSGNQLRTLPPEIGRLKNLIFLGLSRNEITQLPAEIGDLTQLEVLQVFNNKMVEFPQRLENLENLTSLDLHHNQLTTLPLELAKLKRLKDLDLRMNPLKAEQLKPLKQQMKGCNIRF